MQTCFHVSNNAAYVFVGVENITLYSGCLGYVRMPVAMIILLVRPLYFGPNFKAVLH